ncbi:UvrD-helicase domain-containing protein [Amycolatopsis sp. NPDC059021]|uniref:UvrD-helicase domain-containing protein n=1 Tax=Amycolatopsis sp. NPDC059021 TaxID=3346704 RepID=UPI00366A8E7C
MSSQGYDEELRAERAYVDFLYGRLDAERARAAARFGDAVKAQGASSLAERDGFTAVHARELGRLNIADNGLCFGRLDALSGERSYIGRIGLFDEENDYEPLLMDWRAPASKAFYCATPVSPDGMASRRQFRTRGRKILDFTEEMLGAAGEGTGRGDAALMAAVTAPRGEGMRDIVATIQAEQDEVIRLDHAGVTVIEGGPGTGKTAVALHRVAYLLYAKRERLSRRGVLVVGPSSGFLDYIGRVLPSLGETDVVFATPGGLLPGLRITAEESDPEVQRLKGSLEMLDVLAAAVADRQGLPAEPLEIGLSDITIEFDTGVAEAARAKARASGLRHNEARAVFREQVLRDLAERAVDRIGAGWLGSDDPALLASIPAEMLRELERDAQETGGLAAVREDLLAHTRLELEAHDRLMAELDRLWPVLTPRRLLADLLGSAERIAAAGGDPALFRARGAAWTVSDVPLLDEAIELLGEDRAAAEAVAAQERRHAEEYAQGVLDAVTMERDEIIDDEVGLIITDLTDAAELAERQIERDTRDLAERAVEDREWTYGHVVVDEAQELSEMDWRVLMRRCPSRSFTIVGDLAQRRSAAGATSWGAMLSRYVADRWVYRALTVNYRTPSEIMAVAAALLAEFAPGVRPPESVRAAGARPWARQVGADGLAAAIEEFVRAETPGEGTFAVIGPPDIPGVRAPSAVKGLEFDAVLVVEPDRILAEGPRGAAELYVALTRATQRLGVLHTGALPEVLNGLARQKKPVAAGYRRFL